MVDSSRPVPPERDKDGEITATAAWAAGTQPRQFDDEHYARDLSDQAVAAIIHHRRQSDDAREADGFGEPVGWYDGVLASEEINSEVRYMVRDWIIRQEQHRLDQWRRQRTSLTSEAKAHATDLWDALVDSNTKDDVVAALRGPGRSAAVSLRSLGTHLAKRWDRFTP